MKYQLKINTTDKKFVDITNMESLESILIILHIEWNIYTIYKKHGRGDFEIKILEKLCNGLSVRSIFFYESKKTIKLKR